jgi:hypothetical protein
MCLTNEFVKYRPEISQNIRPELITVWLCLVGWETWVTSKKPQNSKNTLDLVSHVSQSGGCFGFSLSNITRIYGGNNEWYLFFLLFRCIIVFGKAEAYLGGLSWSDILTRSELLGDLNEEYLDCVGWKKWQMQNKGHSKCWSSVLEVDFCTRILHCPVISNWIFSSTFSFLQIQPLNLKWWNWLGYTVQLQYLLGSKKSDIWANGQALWL